jgi:hypothetical protein
MMKTFLRLDALGILIGTIALQYLLAGNWWLFALFAILPDVALLAYIGYDGTTRWPSLVYNTLHTYILPILLFMVLWPYQPIYLLGWIAHIALDRLVGYGFKSATNFKLTHLQQIEG